MAIAAIVFLYWAITGAALWAKSPGSDLMDLVICFSLGWVLVPARLVARLI